MRTLLILRHGKAANEDGGLDCDRALTKRGKREAEQMGQRLREHDLVPDRIISSSALRARDTARRVAAESGFSGAIDELDELYLADPEAYITATKQLADHDTERVLLVGHNPGLEALALLLTGEPTSLPTAGLIVCELPIASFSELSLEVSGKLTRFESPKGLEEG
jgi:phosphohistidine phosphatase